MPSIPGVAAADGLDVAPAKGDALQRSIQGDGTMNKILTTLAVGASLFAGLAPAAQAASEVSIARLDCGTPPEPTVVNERFSDTYAFPGLKIQFVFSCYIIKHGDEYLLWDTGHAMTMPKVAPKVSIVDQLAKGGIKPDQIKYVGISHYHADHTGQIDSFPKATLLIGAKEWEAITSPKPAQGVNFKPFESWIKGDSKVEPQPIDKDVFGDGSVIMLRTPGHTPGHSSLLVKLAEKGPVILSGDAVHFRENLDTDGVPAFNFDRAETVASIERLKKIAANLKGQIIIQHDARDVDKLPAFPAFAK
jgi:N-acyl homoserine lactone hydrolase